MNLDITLIIFILLNSVLSIVLIYKIKKINKEKKSALGAIIIADKNSLYVEMKDYESVKKLHESNYAIFEVRIQKNALN